MLDEHPPSARVLDLRVMRHAPAHVGRGASGRRVEHASSSIWCSTSGSDEAAFENRVFGDATFDDAMFDRRVFDSGVFDDAMFEGRVFDSRVFDGRVATSSTLAPANNASAPARVQFGATARRPTTIVWFEYARRGFGDPAA